MIYGITFWWINCQSPFVNTCVTSHRGNTWFFLKDLKLLLFEVLSFLFHFYSFFIPTFSHSPELKFRGDLTYGLNPLLPDALNSISHNPSPAFHPKPPLVNLIDSFLKLLAKVSSFENESNLSEPQSADPNNEAVLSAYENFLTHFVKVRRKLHPKKIWFSKQVPKSARLICVRKLIRHFALHVQYNIFWTHLSPFEAFLDLDPPWH